MAYFLGALGLAQRAARGLDRVAHDHLAARGAGHGAADQQQVAHRIDLDDLQVLDGAADVAHVAGHALAGEHAARRLALADRARRAVEQRRAVGGRAAREVVALDRARKALADRGAGDVDDLARGKDVDLDLGARRQVGALAVGEAELDQRFAGGHLGLGVVPGQRLREPRGLARRRRRPAPPDSRRPRHP